MGGPGLKVRAGTITPGPPPAPPAASGALARLGPSQRRGGDTRLQDRGDGTGQRWGMGTGC